MAIVDYLIAFTIIFGLILIVASKVTKQSIPDMLKGITDWIRDYAEEKKEDSVENYLDLSA